VYCAECPFSVEFAQAQSEIHLRYFWAGSLNPFSPEQVEFVALISISSQNIAGC
jgi:hypothetical protein